MKTILSLTATVTLLGLISLAVAESKATKSTKPAPSTASTKPAPSTASTKPAPSTASTKPAPSTASTKPAPLAESAKMPAKSEGSAISKSASVKPRSKGATAAPAGDPKTEKPVAKNPLTPAQEDKLLVLLNDGTLEELDAIPGVASTRADSIISARPYASVHEIILVEGVGNATFEKILAHGKTLNQRPVVAEANRKS
ncbi:MAG: helix-hairpin-helix domain-containing protein [Verrucomicrobia bacterium]|nr:helix-hairpin-helix domain-containing protein [Verrucomicrobiota bacterium]